MRPGARIGPAGGLLVLTLAACGREPPGPPPREPEPELPPLGSVELSEAARIDALRPLEIPPPAAAPPPRRWDFSPGRRHAYEISQILHQVTVARAGEARTTARSEDRNAGRLELEAEGDGTARARAVIRARSALIDGKPAPREVLDQRPPTRLECRLEEDGAYGPGPRTGGSADLGVLFDAALALREGERASADGKVRTRLTGYFQMEGKECARLESEFEFAPPLPSGKTRLRGWSVGYFCLRARRFLRAEVAVAQSIRMKTLTEKGIWVVRSTDLEVVTRLKLLE